MDIISVEEDIAEEIDIKLHIEKLRALLDAELDKREKEIVVLRYGLQGYEPLTQREVAAYLKISRSYVSRIEKKALKKLRDSFGGNIPDFN